MELTCAFCDTKFEWKKRGRQPNTCGSAQCRRASHTRSTREHRWRSRGGATTETRTCLECDAPFEFVRTEGMMGQGPGFCSDDCRRKRHLSRTLAAQMTYRSGFSKAELALRRRVALLARYALTPASYDALVETQGGVCAICGQTETKHHSLLLKIDHDRSCCAGHGSCGKCIRGLLCSNCNRALGLLADDADVFRSAADYLDRRGNR